MIQAYTFDDVLLTPQFSQYTPAEVSTASSIAGIPVNIPIISAPMDTITEEDMAVIMAVSGGLGIIHRNMPAEDQATLIRNVKKREGWIVYNPLTRGPDSTIAEIIEVMRKYEYSGVPIVDKNKKLLGIVTNRDVRFATNLSLPAEELMTKDNLVVVKEGIKQTQALKLLHERKIEKLLVVNDDYQCIGLITVKDIERSRQFPNASKDNKSRLIVGGAVGVGKEGIARAERLISAEADIITIDTAHGHSKNVIETIKEIKKLHKDFPVMAGNVATQEGAEALIQAGADAIKVGVGPGSICTTRIVAGTGMPQLTAIMEVKKACSKHNVSVIADGGIRNSGDMAKAIAAGADAIMTGLMLAGAYESAGETVIYKGRAYKKYRGMGSIPAMKKGSFDRYAHKSQSTKAVAEGVEGMVPLKGDACDILQNITGGLRSAMGYTGNKTIKEMQNNCKFVKITSAGVTESHPHDISVTDEEPGYYKTR